MKHLTERERDVYLFISDYHEKHGYSPGMRDICKGCYFASVRSAALYIQRLQEKGYIDFTPKVARSIVIRDKATC